MKKLLTCILFVLLLLLVFGCSVSSEKILLFEGKEEFTNFTCTLPDEFPETKEGCHIDLLCSEGKDACKNPETEFLKIAQWAGTQYSAEEAEKCEQISLDYAEACEVFDPEACTSAWQGKSSWEELTEEGKEVCDTLDKEACDEIRGDYELCEPYLSWASPSGQGTCGVQCQVYNALNDLEDCYQESLQKKMDLCQKLYSFGYKQGGEASTKEEVIKSLLKGKGYGHGAYWGALSLCLSNVEGVEESILAWEDNIKRKQQRLDEDYKNKLEYEAWIAANPNDAEGIAKRQSWLVALEKDIKNVKADLADYQQKKENLEDNILDERVNEALAKMSTEEDKLHALIQEEISNPSNQEIDGFKERMESFWEKVSAITKEINLTCAYGKGDTIKEKMPGLEQKVKQLEEEELGETVEVVTEANECGNYCLQTAQGTIGDFYDRTHEFRDYFALMAFIKGQGEIVGPTKAECESECVSKSPFSFGKLEGENCTCPCRDGYVASEGRCLKKIEDVPGKDDLKKNRFKRENISLKNPPEPPPLNDKTKKAIKSILGLNADEFEQGMGEGKKAAIVVSSEVGDYERLWLGRKINLMFAFMKHLGYDVTIYDRHSDDVLLAGMFDPSVDAVASFSHGAEPSLQGLTFDGGLEAVSADYRRTHYEESGMSKQDARIKANTESSLGWSFCYNHSCHGGDSGYKDLANFSLREGGVYYGEEGILWATSHPSLSYTRPYSEGDGS